MVWVRGVVMEGKIHWITTLLLVIDVGTVRGGVIVPQILRHLNQLTVVVYHSPGFGVGFAPAVCREAWLRLLRLKTVVALLYLIS